jgi:hypothetical protein
VLTPSLPARQRDRSRLTQKAVKRSFEGKLHSQVWHCLGFIWPHTHVH